MPLRLPSADTAFGATPTQRPNRVASYDQTGIGQGDLAEGLGAVQGARGLAEAERIGAQVAAQGEQAARIQGDTASIAARTAAQLGGIQATRVGTLGTEAEIARSTATSEEALGKAVTHVGQSFLHAVDQYQRGRNVLQTAQANAGVINGTSELRRQMDADQDPAGMRDRYEPQYQEIVAQHAATIDDPTTRQLFVANHADTIEKGVTAAVNRQTYLANDAMKATALGNIDQLTKDYATAPTAPDRTEKLNAVRGQINGLVETGVITREQGEKWAEQATRAATDGRYGAAPASQKIAALAVNPTSQEAVQFFINKGLTPAQAAGFVGAGPLHESGLNPSARAVGDQKDGSDSVGAAQWDPTRLAGLKAFAAARKMDWQTLPAQYEYMWQELNTTHKSALDALRASTNVRDAAAATTVLYEKPQGSQYGPEASHGWNSRLTKAQALANAYGGIKPELSDVVPFLSPDAGRLQAAEQELDTDARKQQAEMGRVSAAAVDEWNAKGLRVMQGLESLPSIQSIQDDKRLTQHDQNAVIGHYLKLSSDVMKTNEALRLDAAGALSGNPFDKDIQSKVNLVFDAQIPDARALLSPEKQGDVARAQAAALAQRNSYVPDGAVGIIRGGMASTDPKNVEQSLQFASRLMSDNPQAFAASTDRKEIAESVQAFRHLVQLHGPEEAARMVAASNDPVQKSKRLAVRDDIIKGEMTELVKSGFVNDVRSRLSSGLLSYVGFGRPDLAPSDSRIPGLEKDLIDQVDYYRKQGQDLDIAKRLAMDDIVGDPSKQKRGIYGVTNFNGKPTIVKFPPENAAGYPPVAGSQDYIWQQAIQDIKEQHGEAVTRDKLYIDPVTTGPHGDPDGGITRDLFNSGRPVPYIVRFTDSKGMIQQLKPPPGADGWVADPRKAQAEFDVAGRSEEARIRAQATQGAIAARAEGLPAQQLPVMQPGISLPEPGISQRRRERQLGGGGLTLPATPEEMANPQNVPEAIPPGSPPRKQRSR